MLKEIQTKIQQALTVFDNPVIYTLTVMFIGMYASIIAPQGSPALKKVFANIYFKLFFFFIVILLATQEPRLALILSLAFVFTMQGISEWTTKTKIKAVTSLPVPSDITVGAEGDSSTHAEPQFDEITTDDGTIYSVTNETEVGMPLHPDFQHASAQGLGDPIAGYDETEKLNVSPF